MNYHEQVIKQRMDRCMDRILRTKKLLREDPNDAFLRDVLGLLEEQLRRLAITLQKGAK